MPDHNATEQRLKLLVNDSVALINQIKEQGYSPSGAIALLTTSLAALCVAHEVTELLDASINEIIDNTPHISAAWKDTVQ